MDSLANVPAGVFNRGVPETREDRRLLIGFVQCPPVHIREQPETESVVVVVWRVGEAVNNDTVVLGVIDLSHTAVEFVIGD